MAQLVERQSGNLVVTELSWCMAQLVEYQSRTLLVWFEIHNKVFLLQVLSSLNVLSC